MALTDNLSLYCNLTEASGTRPDSSGNGNDLTDNNTVTGNPGPGSHNASQFTKANNEYLSRADNASLSTGNIDYTVTGWMYLADKLGYYGLAGKGNMTSNNSTEYFINYDKDIDRFNVIVGNGAANVMLKADVFGSPSSGTWYFLTIWHDSVGNTINISVNGGTANSVAWSTGLDSASEFAIGTFPVYHTEFHNGRVFGVGFWKRVLTAGEITQLYNSGNGLTYAEMVALGGPSIPVVMHHRKLMAA